MEELFVLEKDGRKRPAIKTRCDFCGKEYLARITDYNKQDKHFCSKNCYHQSRKNRVEFVCDWCGKTFLRIPSYSKNSKHKKYFCSITCKNRAQQLDGIKEMHPDHYGDTPAQYRVAAFRVYEHKCAICGYDKYEEVLQVHHKDKNRKNNSIDNLIILCANCHLLVHNNKINL